MKFLDTSLYYFAQCLPKREVQCLHEINAWDSVGAACARAQAMRLCWQPGPSGQSNGGKPNGHLLSRHPKQWNDKVKTLLEQEILLILWRNKLQNKIPYSSRANRSAPCLAPNLESLSYNFLGHFTKFCSVGWGRLWQNKEVHFSISGTFIHPSLHKFVFILWSVSPQLAKMPWRRTLLCSGKL